MSALQRFRETHFLMRCGVVGPLLFVIVFTIESATRPDYNPFRSMVSELSLSEYGWQQIANFLASGTLVLAFSLGVRRVFQSGTGSTWGPRWLAVTGLGLLVAGVFVCDPGLAYPAGAPAGLPVGGTWQNTLHSVGGAMVFFSLPAALLTFARRFATDPSWKPWTTPTVAATVLAFACFVASNTSAMHGGPAGLFQRLCIMTYMFWLALFAARAARQLSSETDAPLLAAGRPDVT
jgi:hypothetical protein